MQIFPARCGLVALTSLLASCSLTSANVEPALPAGRLNDSSTLVYRANGQPVVTNNSANLFTVLVAFLGDPRAVTGKLAPDSTLTLRSIDSQPSGSFTHLLKLGVPKFKGVGTYLLTVPGANSYAQTTFQLLDTSSPTGPPTYYPEQLVVTGAPASVEVTSWNATTRHLQGIFTLTVAAPGATQAVTTITEGRFDVDVDK